MPEVFLLLSRQKILHFSYHLILHFVWHLQSPAVQSQHRTPALPFVPGKEKSFRFRSTDPTRFLLRSALHILMHIYKAFRSVPDSPDRTTAEKSDILHFQCNR